MFSMSSHSIFPVGLNLSRLVYSDLVCSQFVQQGVRELLPL